MKLQKETIEEFKNKDGIVTMRIKYDEIGRRISIDLFFEDGNRNLKIINNYEKEYTRKVSWFKNGQKEFDVIIKKYSVEGSTWSKDGKLLTKGIIE